MAILLSESPVANTERNLVDRAGNLAEYIALPQIAQLEWPAGVVEQWLFDHARVEAGRDVSMATADKVVAALGLTIKVEPAT
jgi:hypothetical protein